MDTDIAKVTFVRACCIPPIDCLVESNGTWTVTNGCILERNDTLVGKYIPQDPYDKETYFSAFGIYTYFNRERWILIKYSMIQSVDLWPCHTNDKFYNQTNPKFFIETKDNQIIPLYVKRKIRTKDDEPLAFDEIFRLERFVRWAIHRSSAGAHEP